MKDSVSIQEEMNWTQAQNYCRQYHTDLVSGLSQLENLPNDIKSENKSWIGLFRDTWRWSDGRNFSFRNWDLYSFKDNEETKKCAMTVSDGLKWRSGNCSEKKPFFCYNVPDLSNAIKDLERLKLQTKKEFKDAKTQLENHKEDIDSLKREVQELVKHKEIISENVSQIEKKLHTTESQLRDKKTKLENLEVETAAAFSETQKVLNVYKNELSYLNTTAQELEGKIEARLDATKTELEANLKTIQNSSEALDAKLNEQNAEVRDFKEQTESKFRTVDERLKTQNTVVDKHKAAIDTLKSNDEGIKQRLELTEKKSVELNTLTVEVNSLKAEVNTKVAFSATVIESNGVFTGPATTHNILIFNQVFSNIGNAYNSKTGIFTAPVKGVYYFSFMTFGYNSHTSGAILVKNGHYQVSTWEFKGLDASDTTSNTVILELNVRETVNIILWRAISQM
ncbi:hypothetical protein L3Q82_004002 [Scortum barcoo]|uniref:Uncharacterized protein n=1 Tax=Scortum barcoo TaxID=214431 RepID=A0ACB8X6Y0_9TELE|nr:hypothetical protein L3Q82_004002 [Scortum barcoo]